MIVVIVTGLVEHSDSHCEDFWPFERVVSSSIRRSELKINQTTTIEKQIHLYDVSCWNSMKLLTVYPSLVLYHFLCIVYGHISGDSGICCVRMST